MDRFDFFAPLGRLKPGGVSFTSSYLTPLDLNRYSVVAEVGCAYGIRSAWLARSRCCQVFAVDADPRSLELTYQRAEESGAHELLQLVEAPTSAPGLEPGSVDLLIGEESTFELGLEAAIQSWRPLVKPGGHIALCYPGFLNEAGPSEFIEPLQRWVAGPLGDLSAYHNILSESGLRLVHQAQLSTRLWEDFYKEFSRHLRTLTARGLIRPEEPLYQELEAELSWYRGWARRRVFLQAFLLRVPD